MTVKLLTEHHLEFLSLKRGCTGLSESTLAKMPHIAAQLLLVFNEGKRNVKYSLYIYNTSSMHFKIQLLK